MKKGEEKLIAVFLPGIMGSCLSTEPGGQGEIAWGENLWESYGFLIHHFDSFALPSTLYPHKCIDVIRLSNTVQVDLLRMYGDLERQLEYSGRYHKVVMCPYDWRQSNARSAEFISGSIAEAVDITTLREPLKGVKFRFITHSMGGLVLRLAVTMGLIAIENIKDVYHVGPPLAGAPSAFSSLLNCGDLLLFKELAWYKRVYYEYDTWVDRMTEALATFPSIYELMPHSPHDYLRHQDEKLGEQFFNALTKKVYRPVDSTLAEDAVKVHEELERFPEVVEDRFPVHTIYSDECGVFNRTHNQFDVGFGAGEWRIYGEHYIRAGDGTVPEWSAVNVGRSQVPPNDFKKDVGIQHPIPRVVHNKMCSTKRVLEKLKVLKVIR